MDLIKAALSYYKADLQQSNSAKEWKDFKIKVDEATEMNNTDRRLINTLKDYDSLS